jgi:hypothetical protein
MIQELLEIVNMFTVDLMPEIVDLFETAQLGDEVSNLLRLIKCVKVVNRLFVLGKRIASRIQARRSSGE